jgi:alanine racemase
VARLEEAVKARMAAGEGCDILILSEQISDIAMAVRYNITLTACSLKELEHIVNKAEKLNTAVCVHIKADSGMNRLGVKDFAEFKKMLELCRRREILLKGIYTHFADCGDTQFTDRQYDTFLSYVKLAKRLFPDIIAHCASSAAIFKDKRYHLDMVRAGINLYGYCGEYARQNGIRLKPAMEVSARVAAVKKASEGESIGYQRGCFVKKDTYYAVINAGYGDGYSRAFSNKGSVSIGGKVFGVAGNICMDNFMVDLGGCRHDIKAEDRALLFSPYGDRRLTFEYNSKILNTIVYEMLTSFKAAFRKYI